ncbi:MAG: hypothetical protein Q9159_004223 [Coniocarpon cinnabarinum]
MTELPKACPTAKAASKLETSKDVRDVTSSTGRESTHTESLETKVTREVPKLHELPVEILNLILDYVLRRQITSLQTRRHETQQGVTYYTVPSTEKILVNTWISLKHFRSVHTSLANIGLEYWLRILSKNEQDSYRFHLLQYELSIKSLTRLRAVLRNPKLANIIHHIQLVEFPPPSNLCNEEKFKTKLRDRLQRYKSVTNRAKTEPPGYFDRVLAIHWLETVEWCV